MSNRRLKIGCVTSSISYHGGWDTLSKGIIGAVARVHDVVVLTARQQRNDSVTYPIHAVLPRHYISYGLRNQVRVFWQCMKYFRECDVIHVFVEPLAPGAALASKILGIPLVITLAGTYCVIPVHGGVRGFLKRMIMRGMYVRASFIATGSHYNIQLIERVLPLGNKWKFIPFGVDPEKFNAMQPFKPSPFPFLLTVGAVKERKGADYVIRALGILKDEFPSLRYLIAGDDTAKPKFVRRLKNLISEKGLNGRVKFLGRTSDADLLRYYGTCVVFVLAAQTVNGAFEGFPMVFYEAQSYGAPIVTTKGFGSEYVVRDGYNGFLVSQGNTEELASALRKIVANPGLRDEMSRNALAEAKRHSWEAVAVGYLEAYWQVVSPRG